MAAAKTLAESYDGMLSRDWDKLLEIIESGEERVVMWAFEAGGHGPFHFPVTARPRLGEDGSFIGYDIHVFDESRGRTKDRLDQEFLGWFPTKEDGVTPAVEPVPLEWSYNDDRTEAYASCWDWRHGAYSDGDWEVYIDGEAVGGGNAGDIESAIKAVHEWRINHLNSMIRK